MSGGSVLRSIGHAVGAGAAKDVLSATAGAGRPARVLPMSSSSSSSPPPSVAASSSAAGWRSDHRHAIEDEENLRARIGFFGHFVFGPAPSREEAEAAVSALNQLFVQATHCHTLKDGTCSCLGKGAVDEMPILSDIIQKISSAEPELGIEQALHRHIEHAVPFNSLKAFISQREEKIIRAFHLLQSNPSVQGMVVSLSSDKAVWDAVMRNSTIQELKKSFSAAGSREPQSSSRGPDIAARILPDIAARILSWILENTQTKIMEFIDNITKLVKELFNPGEREKSMDALDDLLRSSFMLSVMVLIVVIVTRVQKSLMIH